MSLQTRIQVLETTGRKSFITCIRIVLFAVFSGVYRSMQATRLPNPRANFLKRLLPVMGPLAGERNNVAWWRNTPECSLSDLIFKDFAFVEHPFRSFLVLRFPLFFLLIVPLLLSAASLFLLTGCESKNFRPRDEAYPLMVKQAELQIGETWASNILTHSFAIHNVSDQQVSIKSFQKDCSCTSVSPDSLDIPAGSSKIVTVGIEMARGHGIEKETDVSVRIAPIIQGRTSLVIPWNVTAHVKPLMLLSKSYLSFDVGGPQTASKSRDATQTLQVSYAAPTESLRVENNAADVHIDVHKRSDSLYELSVALADSANENVPFVVTPNFKTVLKSGETVSSTPLVIKSHQYRPVIAEPESLQLGFVYASLGQERTVTLTSQAGEEFLIRSASSSSKDIEVRTAQLDAVPSGVHHIDIRGFRNVGLHESQIQVELQLVGADSPIELTIPVVYYGIKSDVQTGEKSVSKQE